MNGTRTTITITWSSIKVSVRPCRLFIPSQNLFYQIVWKNSRPNFSIYLSSSLTENEYSFRKIYSNWNFAETRSCFSSVIDVTSIGQKIKNNKEKKQMNIGAVTCACVDVGRFKEGPCWRFDTLCRISRRNVGFFLLLKNPVSSIHPMLPYFTSNSDSHSLLLGQWKWHDHPCVMAVPTLTGTFICWFIVWRTMKRSANKMYEQARDNTELEQ